MPNPNFEVAIRALQQRSGVEKLAEPETVTSSSHAVNRMYDARFTVDFTNR